MIIFLYGQNSYLRSKKLVGILNEYKIRLGELLVREFDFAEEGDFDKFSSFIRRQSMFNPKKFAVVDNVFEVGLKKELKKIFEGNLEDKEMMIVAVSDGKAPSAFSFLNEKPVLSQEFKAVKKGAELNAFIKQESEARGVKLNSQEIRGLADALGEDLWAISTELDRLALTADKILPRGINKDYFKLINTLKGEGDVRAKLNALEIILSERGDDPAKVFNMLSCGWSSPELISILANYDVMIKSGKLDYEDALLDWAIRR